MSGAEKATLPLRVLDLFSGIGAFSYGLEQTGAFRTEAFVEIDPFCQRVIAKHWPDRKRYSDITCLTADRLRADGVAPDLIVGGFPCQDISIIGSGDGLAGERSGLWTEFARLIRDLRPRYALVKNVAALLGRGLGDVLGDLAALGYDAEWHCISAASIGAPHVRDRVWIAACAQAPGRTKRGRDRTAGDDPWLSGGPDREVPVAGVPRLAIGPGTLARWAHATATGGGQWATEPPVGRMVDGPADRVDRRERLMALGNAVVPQIPEMLGRIVLDHFERTSRSERGEP